MVVSGLAPNAGSSDEHLFKDLCFTYFSVSIYVVKTSRLSERKDGRIQHLLVTLSGPSDASKLLSMAKNLRSSDDQYIRHNVYISKHLTRAECNEAYAARLSRRSTKTTSASSTQGTIAEGSSSSCSIGLTNCSNVQNIPAAPPSNVVSNSGSNAS